MVVRCESLGGRRHERGELVEIGWLVDGEARTIDVYRHEAGALRVDTRLEGTAGRALPPFPDLLLDPAAVWP